MCRRESGRRCCSSRRTVLRHSRRPRLHHACSKGRCSAACLPWRRCCERLCRPWGTPSAGSPCAITEYGRAEPTRAGSSPSPIAGTCSSWSGRIESLCSRACRRPTEPNAIVEGCRSRSGRGGLSTHRHEEPCPHSMVRQAGGVSVVPDVGSARPSLAGGHGHRGGGGHRVQGSADAVIGRLRSALGLWRDATTSGAPTAWTSDCVQRQVPRRAEWPVIVWPGPVRGSRHGP